MNICITDYERHAHTKPLLHANLSHWMTCSSLLSSLSLQGRDMITRRVVDVGHGTFVDQGAPGKLSLNEKKYRVDIQNEARSLR